MTLRTKTRQEIDNAIGQGATPEVPKNGMGLVLKGPGRTRKVLVTPGGALTPAGRHYYDTTGDAVPKTFDLSLIHI